MEKDWEEMGTSAERFFETTFQKIKTCVLDYIRQDPENTHVIFDSDTYQPHDASYKKDRGPSPFTWLVKSIRDVFENIEITAHVPEEKKITPTGLAWQEEKWEDIHIDVIPVLAPVTPKTVTEEKATHILFFTVKPFEKWTTDLDDEAKLYMILNNDPSMLDCAMSDATLRGKIKERNHRTVNTIRGVEQAQFLGIRRKNAHKKEEELLRMVRRVERFHVQVQPTSTKEFLNLTETGEWIDVTDKLNFADAASHGLYLLKKAS